MWRKNMVLPTPAEMTANDVTESQFKHGINLILENAVDKDLLVQSLNDLKKIYTLKVKTEADRAAIPISQRVNTMYVQVIDSGRLWQWKDAIWTEKDSQFVLSKNYVNASETSNLLFDPFNETVNPVSKADYFQSTQPAVFTELLSTSANSPFNKPTLKGTGSVEVRRFFDVKKMALVGQVNAAAKVAVHYAAAGGSVGIYVRRSDNSVIGSITFTTVFGYNEFVGNLTLASDAHHLLILLSGTSDKELLACAVSCNENPKFVYGAVYPGWLSDTKAVTDQANKTAINLLPDPFFRAYSQGIDIIDGWPTFQEPQALWSIVDYPDSPFSAKKALHLGAQATAMNKNVPWQRLGVKVGDVIRCVFGIVVLDGGFFNVSAYARRSDGAVIGSSGSATANFKSGIYQEISYSVTVTQTMIDEAAVLQLRMNTGNVIFTNGWYCLGLAIYVNQPNNVIRDTNYVEDQLRVAVAHQSPTLTPKFTHGEWYLRETRQRTRKLLLSEANQLVVASIGDSWTHARDRWSGTTAQTLIGEFGDAGGGWTGFGFHPTLTTLVNGNVRASYGYTRTGTWTSTYGTSPSPDICHITSNTAGDKVTTTTPGLPNISGCSLYYVGTANGVIRYRFNGGGWTTVNLSDVDPGNLGMSALMGFSTGAQSLEIEVVSGTCSLCGVNWKSVSSGVVWHKLGATGSQAAQWASVNAAQWQTGLQALKPNLVTIMHGTNDQTNQSVSQFTTSMAMIIDRIKEALPLADILVIMPCENARGLTPTMSQYSKAIYQLCVEKKVAFLDLQYVFGESFHEYSSTSARNWFNVDGIHPEPLTGGRAITDAVMRFLTG